MRTPTLLFSALLLAGASRAATAPEVSGIRYLGGRWFDGERFVAETVHVVGGRLQRQPPSRIVATVDLHGGFVVPPFAEAHTHRVGGDDPRGARFLDAGIFYLAVPNNLPAEPVRAALQLGRPDSVDAIFADGGITGPGGHPLSLAEAAIARGDWTASDGEGAFFHTVADAAADEGAAAAGAEVEPVPRATGRQRRGAAAGRHLAQAVEGDGQALGVDRLEQVVERVHGERLDGVLLVGGDEDGRARRRQRRHGGEAALAAEPDVEERDVQRGTGRRGGDAGEVLDLGDDGDVGVLPQQPRELTPGERLVVDDERPQRGPAS